MNEAENNDTNVAEAAVDAGMANNPIPSQEVAPLEQEPQESSPIGADTVSPVSLNEATETKSEPKKIAICTVIIAAEIAQIKLL